MRTPHTKAKKTENSGSAATGNSKKDVRALAQQAGENTGIIVGSAFGAFLIYMMKISDDLVKIANKVVPAATQNAPVSNDLSSQLYYLFLCSCVAVSSGFLAKYAITNSILAIHTALKETRSETTGRDLSAGYKHRCTPPKKPPHRTLRGTHYGR